MQGRGVPAPVVHESGALTERVDRDGAVRRAREMSLPTPGREEPTSRRGHGGAMPPMAAGKARTAVLSLSPSPSPSPSPNPSLSPTPSRSLIPSLPLPPPLSQPLHRQGGQLRARLRDTAATRRGPQWGAAGRRERRGARHQRPQGSALPHEQPQGESITPIQAICPHNCMVLPFQS